MPVSKQLNEALAEWLKSKIAHSPAEEELRRARNEEDRHNRELDIATKAVIANAGLGKMRPQRYVTAAGRIFRLWVDGAQGRVGIELVESEGAGNG
jgi:hypothetical protein